MKGKVFKPGAVSLGPFELQRPIGRGGMAEVWLGIHRAQQQAVAVKVLTGERAREEAFIRALKNEIHNVARLHHPGIILLFEAGEVDDVAEKNSAGRFAAGSPWFAMELASHGALSPKRLPLPWSTTKMLLLSLLDALAHAHARGVIHRDLKPGNILLCAPDDPRPGLKLTDFGIAQPIGEHIDGEAEQGRLSGTPRYMAPEQFQAKWRDFGPWTDLYALGCIAYQLATGKAPFSGDALKLAIAHCHDVADPPTSQMSKSALAAYPVGYDAWVLRLLEKEPLRRFTCAADAAWALLPLTHDGVEEEVTVIAGWEEALRSLKPGAPGAASAPSEPDAEAADFSGAPTVLRSSSSGEPEADGAAQLDMSQSAISAAIARTEQTNVNTVVDRPVPKRSMPEEGETGTDRALQARPKLASFSSEATGSLPITAALPPELQADDDSLFPKIGAERTPAVKGKKGTKVVPPASTLSGPVAPPPPVQARSPRAVPAPVTVPGAPPPKEPAKDPVALVDTTFAPNVPWTELAALSPKEAMPTLTGRSRLDVGKRRHEVVDESRLAPRSPPPMPPTWRRPGAQAPSRHMLGAGLGLYGLRQIPLVDRDGERDLVWDMLRGVHDGTGARVVVVRGPAGIGKTRLCEWLVERAAEVGAAVSVRAGHGPGGGPLDGLAGLIALHARTIGLEKRALQRRLVEVVRRQRVTDMMPGPPSPEDIEEALALAELLEPSGFAHDPSTEIALTTLVPQPAVAGGAGGAGAAAAAAVEAAKDEGRVRIDSARERHEVALRYLVRAARERPVVAWFDDVQWGADVLAFARAILDDDRAKTAPALIVLSASEEELGERPIEAAALDALTARSDTVLQVHVPHLPERDHRALVEELLGLEEGLAGAVAARTAGNPLFAVQLVGDFVMRGVLEVTPDGFALKRGERAVLPDDLHGVWSERIARVIERAPKGSREALELGSVLGSSGDDGEWEAICAQGGFELSPELIDALVRARLVVRDDEAGLRFAHAMLRESVLRGAAEEGRLEQHHRTAAKMLLKRYGDRRRGVVERIGRHLVAASDHKEALSFLLRAAEEAARTQGYPQAHALLSERDAATDAAGLPEDDPGRAAGWALKSSLLVDEGRVDEARMWAGLVLRYKGDARHAPVVAAALRVRAQCDSLQAKWEDAARHFVDAQHAAEEIGDTAQIVDALCGLADTEHYRGRIDASGVLLAQALTLCQEKRDEERMAFCLWNLAYVSITRGDTDEARNLLLRQQKLARRTGYRSMIANGKNALGDLERLAGHYDEAEARYEDALRLFEAIGSGKRLTLRMNMAMNAAARGNLERAKALSLEVLVELPRLDPRINLCHGVLAASSAHDQKWAAYDEHMKMFIAGREQDTLEVDTPLMFEIVGDHARAKGDDARAAEAYENALDLWQKLGRNDRAANVQSALAKIGTVPKLLRRARKEE